MIGQTISHYRILARLGGGGMGVVYKAEDIELGRLVAIKFIANEIVQDAHALERFRHEARAASALNHPNICTIHEIGTHLGMSFIVMEFLEGETVQQILRAGPLPLARLLQLGVQVAEALHETAEFGIVHRDVKPANIFVTNRGHAKILDFGVAKTVRAARTSADGGNDDTLDDLHTSTGMMVGTMPYMSPEQARGEPVDRRTDLFSLGAVLYEMATGCRAFAGTSPAEIVASILRGNPTAPRTLNPGLPARFEQIVFKALEKSPAARYANAAELRNDLEALLKECTNTANSTSASPRPRKERSSSRFQALVVLPLRNLSNRPDEDYFVDGLTESLITALAKLGGFRVISRTSAMLYKGTAKRIPVIAQELGVDIVVEGSVIRSGGRVRVTAQLIDARVDKHLWAETYDSDLSDILTLHDDISRAVAGSIHTKIARPPRKRQTKLRQIDPGSYDLYLRGRYFWNKRTGENINKGLEFFQGALDIDPLYAPAYAGIADSYCYLGYSFGRLAPRDAMPKAKAAAQRALELDPQLAEAYCSRALIKMFYEWDWVGSEEDFRRAIQLNSSYSVAYHYYSGLLAALRRNDESIAAIQQALAVDPLSLPINNFAGMIYFAARKFEKATETLLKTIEMDTSFVIPHSVYASTLEAQGSNDQAVAEYLRAKQLSGHGSEEIASLQAAYDHGGMRAFHERDLELARAQWVGWHAQSFTVAHICAAVDRRDEAIGWLEKAYDDRSGLLIWLNMGSSAWRAAHCFENLRADPRFQDLMRRLRLPL